MVREPYIQQHIEIPKLKVKKFGMDQMLAYSILYRIGIGIQDSVQDIK